MGPEHPLHPHQTAHMPSGPGKSCRHLTGLHSAGVIGPRRKEVRGVSSGDASQKMGTRNPRLGCWRPVLVFSCLVVQSYPTLCNPTDYSILGSSVHGVLQARILECVAISSSGGICPTQGLNLGLLHCRQILYSLNYREVGD